jgi:hypothetical protein
MSSTAPVEKLVGHNTRTNFATTPKNPTIAKPGALLRIFFMDTL